MYIELLLEILAAVFAVFGLVALVRLLTDSYLMPRQTVSAVIYDGEYPPEDVGCIVRRLGRRFGGAGQLAVIVKEGSELTPEVEKVLKDNDIDVYYAVKR